MAGEGYGSAAESPEEFQTNVTRWNSELEASERVTQQWMKDCRRIENRYTLHSKARSFFDSAGTTIGDFNILHSNTQTMLPAVFGQEPIPIVMRRHRDPDPTGRVASEILERALKAELEMDDFEDVLTRVTLDLLLCGRGVPWVRYEPEFQGDEVTGHRSPIDYVLWSDFRHSPKHTWQEVEKDGWIARCVSMTRQQGLDRFGDVFKEVPLKETNAGAIDRDDFDDNREVIGRAKVWELWDKSSRKVYWFCRDYMDTMLDEKDDPLGLDSFFPCPKPAFGTMANSRLVPTPDYLQYEKLANELDDQTVRISVLTSALRAAGVYDASMEGLGQLLEDDGEARNQMIPVTNYAALQGQGIEGVIQFLPLGAIVEALVGLYDGRERTKQVLYEVSGLSDIMRGQVDPREKLGQSRLKGQFASQRLQSKIKVVEKCARDTLRIKAEIIAEHYDPDTIRQLSGYDLMPEVERVRAEQQAQQQQMQMEWEQMAQQAQQQGMPPPPPPEPQPDMTEEMFMGAVQLLKDQKMRGFRLDIETNSTLMIDDDEEKQRRNEFLESSGNFIERAMGAVLQVPEFGPLMLDMLQFGVRGFRAGRSLESAFEQAAEALKNPPQEEEGPSPEEQAAQAQSEMDMQVAQQKSQMDMQSTQMEGQLKMMQAQAKLREIEAKTEAEQVKAQTEAAIQQAELETKIAEIEIEREKLNMQMEANRQNALTQIATKQATGAPNNAASG